MWNGEYDAACRNLSESAAAHRRSGLPSVVAPTLGYLADAEYRAGRWDEAIAHSTQALSLAEDTDHTSMLALTHAVAAYPLAGRREFAAARRHVRCAVEYARQLADANDLAYAMSASQRCPRACGSIRNSSLVLKSASKLRTPTRR
ncbi:tetratricopeptide repeat protein [Streptomyces hokutonensis]|uniref:tetratricopeptide repeat protein n=1 Tax=Streptomyces hokutonensis TaxID=1306990 RepID=UPI0036B0A8DF